MLFRSKEISAIPTVLAFDILRLNEMTESMKRIREKFEEFAKHPNGPLSAVGKSMAEVLDRWEITTMEAGLHIFLSRENLKKIVRILLDPKTDAKQKESMTKFLQLILQIEEMGS